MNIDLVTLQLSDEDVNAIVPHIASDETMFFGLADSDESTDDAVFSADEAPSEDDLYLDDPVIDDPTRPLACDDARPARSLGSIPRRPQWSKQGETALGGDLIAKSLVKSFIRS